MSEHRGGGENAGDRAVLSVDVELFEHAPAYRSAAGTLDSADVGLEGVRFLRETLERHDATTTAFVVSEIADTHPDAIRALADADHEIASHTHSHRLLTDLSPAESREELAHSRERLEAVTDADVRGFRAPAFDFGADHFQVLVETGYTYDASVAPCRAIPGWYGGDHDHDRPVAATAIDPDASAELVEVPIAVMPGLRLPLTGTWLRFFGVRYTLLGMRLLARRGIAPVLYVHPWELAELPAIEGVPKRVYVRTGEWMRRAIERILSAPFEFTTVGRLADEVGPGDESGFDREGGT
jgi:peptidoglycan/xylan/chitin deacetylase (PgdA/CDA1 family)